MSVIKTCMNCEHHCSTMSDSRTDFHIHDYCTVWRTQIPDCVIFDREGYIAGYSDIEYGLAGCWAFEPRQNTLINKFPEMKNNIKEEYD